MPFPGHLSKSSRHIARLLYAGKAVLRFFNSEDPFEGHHVRGQRARGAAAPEVARRLTFVPTAWDRVGVTDAHRTGDPDIEQAVIARYRLTGDGFGALRNATVSGCCARNCSTGVGCSVAPCDAPAARRNARNSSPVRVGKKGVECAITSVCLRPPRLKRIAMPRGLACGSVSGMSGMPGALEKRTVIGVEGLLRC